MALFPRVGRRQPSVQIAWWLIVSILCLGIFLHLIPFYYMISTSFKDARETLATPPTLWPEHPTLSAWMLGFKLAGVSDSQAIGVVSGSNFPINPFFTFFGNSLIMTLGTLALSLPVTSLAAYANSKLQRGPLARWSFLFFVGALMVPTAVTLLPKLLLTLNFPFALPEGSVPTMPGSEDPLPTIRIYDSYWAIIIPAVFNGFGFIAFKGFFDTIPNSVIQAARVDGGSEFNIFRRIVLPLSIPVYAFVAWVQFSAIWDDFLWPVLTIQDPTRVPTSVAIYKIMNLLLTSGVTDSNQAAQHSEAMRQLLAAGLSWNGLMVLAILQTFPIFVMFLICREYLLRGIRIRGLR